MATNYQIFNPLLTPPFYSAASFPVETEYPFSAFAEWLEAPGDKRPPELCVGIPVELSSMEIGSTGHHIVFNHFDLSYLDANPSHIIAETLITDGGYNPLGVDRSGVPDSIRALLDEYGVPTIILATLIIDIASSQSAGVLKGLLSLKRFIKHFDLELSNTAPYLTCANTIMTTEDIFQVLRAAAYPGGPEVRLFENVEYSRNGTTGITARRIYHYMGLPEEDYIPNTDTFASSKVKFSFIAYTNFGLFDIVDINYDTTTGAFEAPTFGEGQFAPVQHNA